MANHIPFVNTDKDCQLAHKFYRDSSIIRVSLDSLSKTIGSLPVGPGIWLDPAIDGLPPRFFKGGWILGKSS
jgi:hypothetical protein